MPGLVPGIHVFGLAKQKAWMAGDKPGHDASRTLPYDNGCVLPPVGMFGAVLFSVITNSNLLSLRCH